MGSMSPRGGLVPQLFRIYESAGFRPMTGFSPYHFSNWMDAPFTFFLKEKQIHGCGGLSVFEILVLERFNCYLDPQRIFVIGNAMGWSTLALALAFPKAKVVAIDPDTGGLEVTQRLADQNGLNVTALAGCSPQDVPDRVGKHLDGKIDLCLVDAIHTNEAILQDVPAVHGYLTPGAVIVMHDVINWQMTQGFNALRQLLKLEGKILTRTPSGVGVLYHKISAEFEQYLDCFSDDPQMYRAYRQFSQNLLPNPIAEFTNHFK